MATKNRPRTIEQVEPGRLCGNCMKPLPVGVRVIEVGGRRYHPDCPTGGGASALSDALNGQAARTLRKARA